MSAANLKRSMHESIRCTALSEIPEVQELRRALRVLFVLLATVLGYKLMLEPGVVTVTTETSLLYKAAVVGKHPNFLGAVLILAAICMVPFQLQQALAPQWLHRRTVTRHAAFALLAAGAVWLYLFVASCRIDVPALIWLTALNCACCTAAALVLGWSLNSELKKAEEVSC